MKKLALNKNTISSLSNMNLILGGNQNPTSIYEDCGSFNPFRCTQACDGGSNVPPPATEGCTQVTCVTCGNDYTCYWKNCPPD